MAPDPTAANSNSADVPPSGQGVTLSPPVLVDNSNLCRAQMLDNLHLVPIFSGRDPSYTIAEFREKFMQWADFLKWPKDDRLFILHQRVNGEAYTTLKNFKSKITCIEEAFDILHKKFGQEHTPASDLLGFWAFMQPANMPVDEFIAVARQKAQKLVDEQGIPKTLQDNIIDSWLLTMCQKNLKPEIRRAVLARGPTNITELCSFASLEENALRQTMTQTNLVESAQMACAASHATIEESSQLATIVSDMAGQLAKLMEKMNTWEKTQQRPDPRSRPKADIICLYCNRRGHKRFECRKLMRDKERNDRFFDNSFRNSRPPSPYPSDNQNRQNRPQSNDRTNFNEPRNRSRDHTPENQRRSNSPFRSQARPWEGAHPQSQSQQRERRVSFEQNPQQNTQRTPLN